MIYHYTECGLDNIYLNNGFKLHKTPYDDGVSFSDINDLHVAIGNWLLSVPNPLNGAELKFVRLEMELTQKNLSEMIGKDEQSIRRWEKKRKNDISDPSAERLLRVLYNDFLNGDGCVKHMIERLNKLDQIDKSHVTFTKGKKWKPAPLAA